MLPVLVNALTDNLPSAGKQPAPAAPAAPVAPIAETGIATRTQLSTAVTAATTLAGYNAAASQAPKPNARLLSNAASSQLAAQYIAQMPEATDDDLAIFARRDQSPSDDVGKDDTEKTDDFLAPLRAARDGPTATINTPSTNPNPAATLTQPAAEKAAAPPAAPSLSPLAASTIASLPGTQGTANAVASPAIRLPVARLETGGRKPGIAQARGTNAYALVDTRNRTERLPTVTTVS